MYCEWFTVSFTTPPLLTFSWLKFWISGVTELCINLKITMWDLYPLKRTVQEDQNPIDKRFFVKNLHETDDVLLVFRLEGLLISDSRENYLYFSYSSKVPRCRMFRHSRPSRPWIRGIVCSKTSSMWGYHLDVKFIYNACCDWLRVDSLRVEDEWYQPIDMNSDRVFIY